MKRTLRHALILLLGITFFVAPGAAAYALWSATATGTLTIGTAVPAPPPSAPTGFFCTDMDSANQQADFTWSSVAGAASYRIYELSGGSAFLRRTSISGASYNNLTRTEGAGSDLSTQVLVVRTVNPDGQESANSNQVTVNYSSSSSCGAPATPSNFTATFTACGQATLSWNVTTNATSYVVSWRPSGSSGSYTDLPSLTTTSLNVTQAQFGSNEVIQFRVRAVNQAGSSSSSSSQTLDLIPASCDPVVLYLDNPGTGNTTSSTHLNLKTSSPSGSLANYDTNRDSVAGLLLAKGAGLSETDTNKQQRWSVVGPVAKNGPVTLTLWSAMKGFDTSKSGSVVAGLYQCDNNNNFSTCSLLGSSTVAPGGSWSGGSNTWVQKTWNFGTLNVNVPSTKRLYVKLVVNPASADEMLFAYDTSTYPSALTIG